MGQEVLVEVDRCALQPGGNTQLQLSDNARHGTTTVHDAMILSRDQREHMEGS
jgi:hypothetical protein